MLLKAYLVQRVKIQCSSLQQACLNLDIDIISLDLTEKLPFNLKRQQINAVSNYGCLQCKTK